MHKADEEILRTFFRLDEARRQRLRLERLLTPEVFNWTKRGAPPRQSWSTLIKLEELANLGLDRAALEDWREVERKAKADLEQLARDHPLATYWEPIKGLGWYLLGCFIAAAGDIERAPTVSSFWKGMGLDIVDGKAPRNTRGRRGAAQQERPRAAMPHVTLVGEQIRSQFLRAGGRLDAFYRRFKEEAVGKWPEGPKMRWHKHGLRVTQKLLYACLWKCYREAYGLPAPAPYAFEILQHRSEPIRIQHFYEDGPEWF